MCGDGGGVVMVLVVVNVGMLVKVVKVDPETCPAECGSPSSRPGGDSPLICTFFFILQYTKLMKRKEYIIFLMQFCICCFIPQLLIL